MAKLIEAGFWEQVPSPFCGIGSDDLTIQIGEDGQVRVKEHGDPITRAGFEQPLGDRQPMVDGVPATLEDAVARAAKILKNAELPLISGLAADVNGVRAALSLADRIGAVVDTMNGDASLRNILVLQDSGWMTTTLAEVKNRADLIVIVGTDVEQDFPRFFERHVWIDGMFIRASERRVVYLGKGPSGGAARSQDEQSRQVLDCNPADLPHVLAVLRALIKGETVAVEAVGGVPCTELAILAEALRQARYGVVVWSAAALDWPHAELTVQTVCELIKEINRTTRCSGLPLGGKEGDLTAIQVCGWQTGYPLRVRFGRGAPEYDPFLNASERLLKQGEVDALLWLSAFNVERTPPLADLPTIVVGRCGMNFGRVPEVFIPVGCPGIDHAGHTYRTDNVVAIRLYQLRSVGLPSSARVIQAIERRL